MYICVAAVCVALLNLKYPFPGSALVVVLLYLHLTPGCRPSIPVAPVEPTSP